MKEDIYDDLVERLKSYHPKLVNKSALKDSVLKEIGSKGGGSNKLLSFLRIAAAIFLLINVGGYSWLEITTRQNRLLVEQKNKNIPANYRNDWQCRQSVNSFVSSLVNSRVISFDQKEVLLHKEGVNDLKKTNLALFLDVRELLGCLKEKYPIVYESYVTGEVVRLSSWQLRKEYGVCNWLNN